MTPRPLVSSLLFASLLAGCRDEAPAANPAPSASAVAPAASSASSASSAPETTAAPPRPKGDAMNESRWARGVEHAQAVASTAASAYILREDGHLERWDDRKGSLPDLETTPEARVVVTAGRTVCLATNDRQVICRHDPLEMPAADDDGARPIEMPPWRTINDLTDVVTMGASEFDWVKSDGESRGGPIWYGVRSDGSVVGWEVPPSEEAKPELHVVKGISKATSVAVGEDHACAVLTGGAVQCWHHANVLASDDPGPRPPAVEPTPIKDAVGATGRCIRRASGPSSCLVRSGTWKEALAKGRKAQFEEAADGLTRGYGPRGPRCSVRDDGTASCEGWLNADPFLAAEVVDLSLGRGHACVLRKDRSVWCRRRSGR